MPDIKSTGSPRARYATISRFFGYRFGANGSVWSRRGRDGKLTKAWRRLATSPKKNGYRIVSLPIEGVGKRTFNVHRLILEAFVGPCPEGMEACHNDGDRGNNRLNNLRWDTRSANMADRFRHEEERYQRFYTRACAELAAIKAGKRNPTRTTY